MANKIIFIISTLLLLASCNNNGVCELEYSVHNNSDRDVILEYTKENGDARESYRVARGKELIFFIDRVRERDIDDLVRNMEEIPFDSFEIYDSTYRVPSCDVSNMVCWRKSSDCRENTPPQVKYILKNSSFEN